MAFGTAASRSQHLQTLQTECHGNSQVYREHVEQLISFFRKPLLNDDPKYKRIKIEVLSLKWPKPSVKQFLLDAGWFAEGEYLVFKGDKEHTKMILGELTGERTVVRPKDEEWIETSKVENVNYTGWQDQREQRLREAAAIQRDKDLDAYRKDEAERKRVAANTILNIKSDTRFRKQVNRFYNTPRIQHQGDDTQHDQDQWQQ